MKVRARKKPSAARSARRVRDAAAPDPSDFRIVSVLLEDARLSYR